MSRNNLRSQAVALIQAVALLSGGFPAARAQAQPASGAGPAPFRFDRPGPIEAPKAEMPLSLTASDGTGLKLSRLAARAVVEGPAAFTELQLAFENPEDRVIEGQFRIALPQGASVSRFAMKTDHGWQEGEVVDRGKARAVYEDFLHRRQDPALLEAAAGNEFSARVFPIPPKGLKELIISYSQELSRADAGYTLSLKGLPEVGELDVAVSADGKALPGLRRTHYVPASDFEASLPKAGPASGLRNKDLAVVRVRPLLRAQPESVPSLLVLFDTSASRILGFDAQVKLLGRLIEGLAKGSGAATPVTVAGFDQTVRLVYEGEAGGFGDSALALLRKPRALGASNLMGALRWAEGQLKKRPAKRLLLITDGVATQDATEADKLRAAVKKLKAVGAERLDAVAVGGIRDEDLLKRLVTAGLPRDGAVADGSQPVESIGAKLTEATSSGLEVDVEGASWVWPKVIDGLQAKDDVFVFAELPESQPLRLTVGRRAVNVPPGSLASAERPLVERAWAKAKIASLLLKRESADGREAKAKVQAEIVDLSVRHRIITPFTSLLVLETLEDYARYGIDRASLANILTVQDHAVRVVHRTAESVALPAQPARPPAVAKKSKSIAAVRGGSAANILSGAAPPQAAPQAANVAAFEPGAAAPAAGDMDQALMAPAEAPPMRASGASMDSFGSGGIGGGGAMGAVMPMLAAPSPVAEAPMLERAMEIRAREMERADRAQARARAPSPHPAPPPVAGSPGSPAAAMSQRPQQGPLPYTGKFKEVMDLIKAGKADKAVIAARAWLDESPGDVMAIVALGEAFEAAKDWTGAARAYGSIIDLYPSRADLRRYAGERLERLPSPGVAGEGVPLRAGREGGLPDALGLAADTYEKAVENRPDHPSSHRLYAFALLKKGRHRQAFEAMARGKSQQYPAGRFNGVERILAEDLGLIAAAWIKAEPGRKADILQRLAAAGGTPENAPSVRFVLNWETDANDVDFHIYDGKGGHAFYSSKALPSGGELYADVTTGYGPECFTIRKARADRAFPYTLQAHYYSRGPMGYGMGKLEIVEHDGLGGLSFQERPFVVMVDQAFLDLGQLKK